MATTEKYPTLAAGDQLTGTDASGNQKLPLREIQKLGLASHMLQCELRRKRQAYIVFKTMPRFSSA